MSVPSTERQAPAGSTPVTLLPEDVARWLESTLESEETVSACLYADIAPGGEFGERWAFLTDRRLFVLEPNGKPEAAELTFDMRLSQIEEAELRHVRGLQRPDRARL